MAAATTASASSQPIAPANRGSVTVVAQGSVDTNIQATMLPDASADACRPPVAMASTTATRIHEATPGSIDIIQWTVAIVSLLSPDVSARS
jgi:hypothetical protein